MAQELLIVGASGTGKSSLLSWACTHLEELGVSNYIHVPFQESSGYNLTFERTLQHWLGLSYVSESESSSFLYQHWGINDWDDCDMISTLLNAQTEFGNIRKENISLNEKHHCLIRLFHHLSQIRPLLIDYGIEEEV